MSKSDSNITAAIDGHELTSAGFAPFEPRLTTPAAFDAIATLRRRRLAVLCLNVGTWFLLMIWAGSILTAGSLTSINAIMLLCLALATPWTILGFWNALIGFWQLRFPSSGFAKAVGAEAAGEPDKITVDTAVLLTLRNENADRALLRLATIKASLDATGDGRRFAYFVLSDTNDAAIAALEEAAVGRWRKREGAGASIIYRRRSDNSGFKAGNVRDFCERWGNAFEFMLPLDADSLMTGEAITRMVRLMQGHPRLGILQSLVVGAPSSSMFARIFQFGMRFGMRSYTAGQAWWTGDCGPYWGHNALVRIRPFVAHCAMPCRLGDGPLGGEVLSHDQIEAALMRRAGYEVRVLPVEGGSYEDNPPNVLEFMRRDVRWCQGNLQYMKLMGLTGLESVSRFQLAWAVLMFAGIPAWTILMALMPLFAGDAQMLSGFPIASAKVFYLILLLMYLTPKLAGIADAICTPGEIARFGGGWRFATGAFVEIVFSLLLGAITTIRITIFMAGLLVGKSIIWGGQQRDEEEVGWGQAFAALWPQLLFGAIVCGGLAIASPQTFVWSLPLTAGYVLAVPFAVLTANKKFGRGLQRAGIAGVPEDFVRLPEIDAVQTAAAR